ncbi:MAG: hypothetical protein AAGI38_10675 [Bacteroidota bacterium]
MNQMRNEFTYLLSVLLVISMLIMGCDNDSDSDDNPPIQTDVVIIPSANTILQTGMTREFSANVDVTWSVVEAGGGSISATGVYQSPDNSGVYTIKAVAPGDSSNFSTLEVIVSKKAAAFNLMKSGGYVVYFRHGFARSGIDNLSSTDPDWWKTCDSTIARQLSPQGRRESIETGQVIDRLELNYVRTFSSEFCRCRQTFDLMDLSVNYTTEPAITYWVYDETDRFRRTDSLIAAQEIAANELVLISSHSFAGGGDYPEGIDQGDAVIFRPNPTPGGRPEWIDKITVEEWVALFKPE